MPQSNQFYSVYDQDALHLINAQIGTANYLLRPRVSQEQIPDASAFSNEDLWKNILPPERYRAGMTLSLERFFLFEWFPRAPGLYFTTQGKEARQMARSFLRRVSVPRKSGTHYLDPTRKDREFLDIYDPFGKISMLKGGVGCIRLRPKLLDSGVVWFMSASSTGVAHEGFPVALSDQMYQQYIHSISKAGALRCTLRGKLQFLPEPVAEIYREYRGVPQLYLLVEQIVLDKDQDHEDLLVSAGISFLSNFEGVEKMYATYATFDSGTPNSVDEVVNWLQEVYVEDLYGGRVITDFDEQMSRFADATFSLRNVLSNRVDRQQAQTIIQTLNLHTANAGQLFIGLNQIERVQVERMVMMQDNRSINIGNGATISAPLFIANDIQDSFNTLQQSETTQELKVLLDGLLKAVSQAAQVAPSPAAQNAARDTRYLVEEVSAKESRPGEGIRLGQRIKEWAQTVGEIGKPIIELVTTLIPLLPR